MQEGGGFAFHPLPMVHDPNYRPKHIIVNCLGKFTFTINECFVVHDGFLAMIYLLLIMVIHTMYIVWHTIGLLTHAIRLLIARKNFIIIG
jgi:hypothetical protein